MKHCAVTGVVVLLVSTLGCGGESADLSALRKNPLRALKTAETFEMFSLEPVGAADHFHTQKILGKTEVTDQKIRDQVIAAFTKGLKDAEFGALCFEPRHGIRVTSHARTVDFVICFECGHVEVYVENEEVTGLPISDSPQALFDKVLGEAGVPLAEKHQK